MGIERLLYAPAILFLMTRSSKITIGILSIATFIIFLPMFMGVQRQARVAGARGCMLMIKQGADRYARKHDGAYPKTYRELVPFIPKAAKRKGILPENVITGISDTAYLYDFPQACAEQLTKGKLFCLNKVGRAGCIGYGCTADRRHIAIVGFDNEDFEGAPLRGLGDRIIVLREDARIPDMYTLLKKQETASAPE